MYYNNEFIDFPISLWMFQTREFMENDAMSFELKHWLASSSVWTPFNIFIQINSKCHAHRRMTFNLSCLFVINESLCVCVWIDRWPRQSYGYHDFRFSTEYIQGAHKQ